MAIDETTRQRWEKEDKMFKTKTLLGWVENLMLLVGEAYAVLDTDRAYFEEIKSRLERLDKINAPPDDINVPF